MIVAAWPGGTITMVNELYGSELKSHVYRAFPLFLQETHPKLKIIGNKLFFILYLAHSHVFAEFLVYDQRIPGYFGHPRILQMAEFPYPPSVRVSKESLDTSVIRGLSTDCGLPPNGKHGRIVKPAYNLGGIAQDVNKMLP